MEAVKCMKHKLNGVLTTDMTHTLCSHRLSYSQLVSFQSF